MTTTIRSNGSKFAGEQPDTIETLLQVLKDHPLDRSFEACGNFIQHEPITGNVRFFGNFVTVSHVFSIDSTEADVIQSLTLAIQANQRRKDYRAQRKPEARKR